MRLAFIPATGVALIALAGCVPQSQYDDLMNAYRSKEQQLLQLQNEFDTSRANEDMLRKQLGVALPRDGPSARTVAAPLAVPLDVAFCGPAMSRVHLRHTLAGEGGRDTDVDVNADT